MYQRLAIDRVALTKLLNTPAVIRIVTILDITSLSILEMFRITRISSLYFRVYDVNDLRMN